MLLEPLADYFNARFAREHGTDARPFIIEDGRILGLFGPIQVGSAFTPVRATDDQAAIGGHFAQMQVSPVDGARLGRQGTDANFESIVNLDRLTRTVHMLNYLPLSHRGGHLFLDVDPRHVLWVSGNHGAYFEEVIVRCGLKTEDIVISVAAANLGPAKEQARLVTALNNYRHRGYLVAVNVGLAYTANGLFDFIGKIRPDFLRINAPGSQPADLFAQIAWPTALAALKELAELLGGQAILQQVDNPGQAFIAANLGFPWVQGHYYDQLASDDYRCL